MHDLRQAVTTDSRRAPVHRSRRATVLLIVALVCELAAAYTLRWPLTTATLSTAIEFQMGQVVVASENWQREGGWTRRFVPSRTVDQHLPEWADRDEFWRDYVSLPPLAFMLHYAATRAFPHVEPVLLGKLLAHVLIAAAILASAPLLAFAFGAPAALIALSFAIWSAPFLIWFINGYFGTTPALAFHLVFLAGAVATLYTDTRVTWWQFAAMGGCAFAGAFSEWVALFGNMVAVPILVAVAVALGRARPTAARNAALLALVTVGGSVAAVAATFALYGSLLGLDFYWRQLMYRVSYRSGDAPLLAHTGIVIRQMLTAWPAHVLWVLAGTAIATVAGAVRRLRAHGMTDRLGLTVLAAVPLGLGSSVVYHFKLRNLNAIHYWFTGSWTLAWAMTLAAGVALLQSDVLPAFGGRRRARYAHGAVLAAIVVWAIGANVAAGHLAVWREGLSRTNPIDIYRSLGRDMPRDGAPLVVAGFPEWFQHYPSTTAYLRRPVVRLADTGQFHLLGTTERAEHQLDLHGPIAYVVYNPMDRSCVGEPMPLGDWQRRVPLDVCRVHVADLLKEPGTIVSVGTPDTASNLSRFIDWVLTRPDCCSRRRLLELTHLTHQRLLRADRATLDRLRQDPTEALSRLMRRWESLLLSRPGPQRFTSSTLLGILADDERWTMVIGNLHGEPIPAFHAGTGLLANYKQLRFVTPRVTTLDGSGYLPVVMIEVTPNTALPTEGLLLELWDYDDRLLRREGVSIVPLDGDRR
jgi:hypothetical protein